MVIRIFGKIQYAVAEWIVSLNIEQIGDKMDKMAMTKAALDQKKADVAVAYSTMAIAKASSKSNMAKQKANVMLGKIKQATA